MLKFVLLFLTLSGLQAAPLASLRRLQKIPLANQLTDGFQQGPEPFGKLPADLDAGLVQEHMSERDRRALTGNGFGEMERRHWLNDEGHAEVPVQKNGGGWVRVEEYSSSHLASGFRQGTEPSHQIPNGFRQGTEPSHQIPNGFRQGTEPSHRIPNGFRQGTEPSHHIPEGFRQGTEPSHRIPNGFRQGTEPSYHIPEGFRQGTEPSYNIPEGFRQGTEPSHRIPEGFRQGTEPSYHIPNGFRQGTEPSHRIPNGFRQGTEPSLRIPDGFRQGTEPFMSIPDGFRQGTEPFMSIPDGFRQGTEPFMSIPDGFRQGTEPFMSIPDGFRQGTEPVLSIPEGFRQGTEPSTSKLQTGSVACKGDIIDGNCYEFNPTPLNFHDAQSSCKVVGPNAQLVSVTSADLLSRLVSMVTNGGDSNPVLTWLGGTVKNQKASWVDGSEWNYSDWMPGHPNIHTDKPVCVEMFREDQSWWTTADCELKRASICSYPIAA